MENMMDRYLDYLEGTTPEERLGDVCRHGWPGSDCGSAHPYMAEPTDPRDEEYIGGYAPGLDDV